MKPDSPAFVPAPEDLRARVLASRQPVAEYLVDLAADGPRASIRNVGAAAARRDALEALIDAALGDVPAKGPRGR